MYTYTYIIYLRLRAIMFFCVDGIERALLIYHSGVSSPENGDNPPPPPDKVPLFALRGYASILLSDIIATPIFICMAVVSLRITCQHIRGNFIAMGFVSVLVVVLGYLKIYLQEIYAGKCSEYMFEKYCVRMLNINNETYTQHDIFYDIGI